MATLTRPIAWAPEALVEAGVITGEQARRFLADGKRAVPERPRLSVRGRKRGEKTTRYIWGPDLRFLLGR